MRLCSRLAGMTISLTVILLELTNDITLALHPAGRDSWQGWEGLLGGLGGCKTRVPPLTSDTLSWGRPSGGRGSRQCSCVLCPAAYYESSYDTSGGRRDGLLRPGRWWYRSPWPRPWATSSLSPSTSCTASSTACREPKANRAHNTTPRGNYFAYVKSFQY